MPATVTHAFFANDVYDILPGEIREKLDLRRCKMFGQSVDCLMFYNLFSILPGKNIREFDDYFHENKSQEFFINILRYIREKRIQDVDTYSFLVGFLCHFVLDSTVHPYVFYKTGKFVKGDPSTYKYNNVHAFMEAFLDNDMIKRRTNTNPYFFDIGKFCFDLKPFSNDLNQTISFSFYHTFRMKEMSSIYYKSLKQMKNALMLFRRDPYGIKKTVYKLVDTFTPKGAYRFEAISYHYPLEDKHNYLNNNHQVWRNPTTYEMESTESFVDLYLKSIREAKRIIVSCFDYLNGDDISLEKVIPNLSYATGIDCDNKKPLKYFEY